MRPRDNEIVFVVDEDAGPNVVKGIQAAGGKAILLTDRSPPGTPDVIWLAQVAQWGHAIVTRDFAMRSVPAEEAALKRSGCHVFILRCPSAGIDELHEIAKLHFPTMLRMVQKYATPFLAHVTAKSVNTHCELVRRAGIKRER